MSVGGMSTDWEHHSWSTVVLTSPVTGCRIASQSKTFTSYSALQCFTVDKSNYSEVETVTDNLGLYNGTICLLSTRDFGGKNRSVS